jgi:GNAT superfamily N-acetyltransferase
VPLVGAYLDFYEVPGEPAAVEAFCRALLADPEHGGVQLVARDADGAAVGFATVFWTWATTRLARLAIMNDLYVAPAARGTGVAEELIAAAREAAREHGCAALEWETALDNKRAQAVYDRVGGIRSEWLTYELPTA